MTVYGVYYSDCKYEGGSHKAMFSTFEKAREYAIAFVDAEREEAELRHAQNEREGYGVDRVPEPWIEEGPRAWGNGMSIVMIDTFVVDDEAAFREVVETRLRNREWEAQHRAEHEALS